MLRLSAILEWHHLSHQTVLHMVIHLSKTIYIYLTVICKYKMAEITMTQPHPYKLGGLETTMSILEEIRRTEFLVYTTQAMECGPPEGNTISRWV